MNLFLQLISSKCAVFLIAQVFLTCKETQLPGDLFEFWVVSKVADSHSLLSSQPHLHDLKLFFSPWHLQFLQGCIWITRVWLYQIWSQTQEGLLGIPGAVSLVFWCFQKPPFEQTIQKRQVMLRQNLGVRVARFESAYLKTEHNSNEKPTQSVDTA